MRKSPVFYLLLALVLVAAWYLKNNNSTEPAGNKPFIDRIDEIVYTKHAKCRMECRHISEQEVKEIIRNGQVNLQKSAPDDRPCPTVAIEGYSNTDRQHIRLILADCETALKLVTCIDLEKDHSCTCN